MPRNIWEGNKILLSSDYAVNMRIHTVRKAIRHKFKYSRSFIPNLWLSGCPRLQILCMDLDSWPFWNLPKITICFREMWIGWSVNCSTTHVSAVTYIYIYIYTHTHIYIYIYTHTHIYIYIIFLPYLLSFSSIKKKKKRKRRKRRKKHLLSLLLLLLCICIYMFMYMYTGCNRRNEPDFGSVFLMLNYTETPQNTYIQSSMVTEI